MLIKDNSLKDKLQPILNKDEEQKRKDLIELSIMSLNNPPPKPDVLLSMGGTEMFTCGDISTIVSRAGHGKTTLLSLVCGQMINPTDEFFESQLRDDKPILYFDTEQQDYDVWRVLHRLHKLTGLNQEELQSRILVFKTEHIGDKGRKDFIFKIIREHEPQFVIIDGLTDLVPTINDEEIAKKTIAEMRGIANEFGTHILSIVHANEGAKTDEPRGWIGKEGVRKSEGVIGVKFDNKEFKVNCQKGRHGRFKDWTFELDQTTTMPYFTGEREKTIKEVNREEGKNALTDNQARYELAIELSQRGETQDAVKNGATQKDLQKILQDKDGIGITASQKLIKLMVEDGSVFQRDGGKIVLVNSNQTSITDDLPF